MPCLRNVLIWSNSTLPLMTFGTPVANIPCQKRAILSSRGAFVVIIR